MITTTNLSMRFGDKILFKNVNLQLNPGKHYGLVGANGSGKSTLIKIINDEYTPEKGDIVIPSLVKVGNLKQNHYLYDNETLLNTVLMGNPQLWKAMSSQISLLELENFTHDECEQLAHHEKTITQHNGYAAPSEAGKLLEGLGLPAWLHNQPLKTLSGGYKLRVLLAQLLFSNPDVLMLDEPTNHLDIYSIRWLEGYLQNFPNTLLVSSHDRHFLNSVCDHIVDVDHETIKIYKGNFDDFEAAKLFYAEQKETALEKQGKKKEHLMSFIDRFKAKASKARQAQSKMKLVEKLDEQMDGIDLTPSCRCYPVVKFDIYRPSGVRALKLNALSKSFGEKQVLKDISFEVERGDKIAFIGANGIGKSTLLEILTNSIDSTSGAFEWGHAAQHAYFPQDHSRHVNGDYTLLSWLGQFDRQMPEEKLRDLLGKVLFSGDDVHKSIRVLSGGETARLLLAKMMLAKHNVLIFDEPTNHLDMEATESLIEALQNYEGTILFVSHNRHFIGNIANRIIEMTSQGLKDHKGSYEEYLAKCDLDLLDAKASIKANAVTKDNESSKKQYEDQKQRQRQKEQLEKKVSAAEDKCHKLELEMLKVDERFATDGFYQKTPKAEIDKLLAEKDRLAKDLNQAMETWEKLSTELHKG